MIIDTYTTTTTILSTKATTTTTTTTTTTKTTELSRTKRPIPSKDPVLVSSLLKGRKESSSTKSKISFTSLLLLLTLFLVSSSLLTSDMVFQVSKLSILSLSRTSTSTSSSKGRNSFSSILPYASSFVLNNSFSTCTNNKYNQNKNTVSNSQCRTSSTVSSMLSSQNNNNNQMSSSLSSSRLLSTTTPTTTTSESVSDTITTNNMSSTIQPDQQQSAVDIVEVLGNEKDFIKPDRDVRQYRWIKLTNNLQVLLVSTSESLSASTSTADTTSTNTNTRTGIEAASVHVQAGHMDDTIPGLAHFHEHMVFLGTNKYPNEDEFQSFLSQNGGRSNAYTDMEDTNYYFSVTTDLPSTTTSTSTTGTTSNNNGKISDGLYGGLDRLAQFFIAPTFSADAVDREVNAITSEYVNGKASDGFRNFQLLKSLCNQQHNFSKFGCGNNVTLLSIKENENDVENMSSPNIDKLLTELHAFWNNYYKTYNLRLSVVSHSTLDVLQDAVTTTFGQLPYSTGEPRRIKNNSNQIFPRENAVYTGSPAFSLVGGQLGKVRYIKPLKESRSIQLMFIIPPLSDPVLSKYKPYDVISHILGHEGPGSLHSYLNDKGYINSLSTGCGINTADFAFFQISVSLTRDGIQNKDEIITLLYQWIALLRSLSPSTIELFYNEIQQLSNVNFKFYEFSNPVSFCSASAKTMFQENLIPSNILSTSLVTEKYNNTLTQLLLDRLVPENCMIHITDSDYKNDENIKKTNEWITEPLYGATYKEETITVKQMEQWKDLSQPIRERLHIPALNKYIPTDFTLRCNDNDREDEEEVGVNDTTLVKNETDDSKSEIVSSTKNVTSLPPQILRDTTNLRLWYKMDTFWRVPKTHIKASFISPSVYSTPRNMTYNRIYQRILNDDLNSYVYDAALAGCTFRVDCTTTGYRLSVFGYNEKLLSLFDTVSSRMLSLIDDMRTNDPLLLDKFNKAKEALLRETKNTRLDPPYKTAVYNSRLIIEDGIWFLDDYINLMEGTEAQRNPLTMIECADAAQESFTGRIKCELLCMGNINKVQCYDVEKIINERFLNDSKYLSDAEIHRFRSHVLPTKKEAIAFFGPSIESRTIPIIYQQLAQSVTEENNAVEVVLQVGCDLQLGYEGIAVLNLITHMAYNSAFTQLRTKEQLGYIVSAQAKKNVGGVWGMSIIVQSSSVLPDVLQERCEHWLENVFRTELEDMSTDTIKREASAVISQLLKSDTKLSKEVSRVWNEIIATEGLVNSLRTPVFDRVEKVAQELYVVDDSNSVISSDSADDVTTTTVTDTKVKTSSQLKERILYYFDTYLRANSNQRRAICSRVYSQTNMEQYESFINQPGVLSSYTDILQFKQYLSTYPTIPYWAVAAAAATATTATTTTATPATTKK